MTKRAKAKGDYRTLWLSDRNWAALDRLAIEADAVPTTGRKVAGHDERQPSWHTLIRLMATGKVGVHRVGEVVEPGEATALIRWTIEKLHALKPVALELRPLKRKIMQALREGRVPE